MSWHRRWRLAEPCGGHELEAPSARNRSGASPAMLHAEVDGEGAVAVQRQDPAEAIVLVVFEHEDLVSSWRGTERPREVT